VYDKLLKPRQSFRITSYFLSINDQIGSGPNQSPLHWVTGALFAAVKRPGREANPLVRRLRMTGAIPPLPLYTFMARIRTVSPFVFFYRIYLRDCDISTHTNI